MHARNSSDTAWMTTVAPVPPPGTATTSAAITTMIRMLRAVVSDIVRLSVRRVASGLLRRLRWRLGMVHLLGGRAVDPLGCEPVAHPEVRVDVAPLGRQRLELLAELSHEHVDRAVAADHRVAPHPLIDVLALEHAAVGGGELTHELVLLARQGRAAIADVRVEHLGPDLELT